MDFEEARNGDGGATLAQVFGKNLGKAMRERGMSYSALARKVGVTRQSVANWVNGIGMPSRARLEKIAEAVGKTEGYLLGFPASLSQAAANARRKPAPHDMPLFGGEKRRDKGGARVLDVHFCLSDEERGLLREHCERIGEPVSAFARQAVMERVLGEKDRRLRVDLDGGSEAVLREMASIRGTSPEREAERILKAETRREWALLGDFVKEIAAKSGEPDAADEPRDAERRL